MIAQFFETLHMSLIGNQEDNDYYSLSSSNDDEDVMQAVSSMMEVKTSEEAQAFDGKTYFVFESNTCAKEYNDSRSQPCTIGNAYPYPYSI